MIGKKLKQLRTERRWSQSDLARLVNVTQQAVAQWKCDKRDPDLPTLISLARIFGVTTDELLDFDPADGDRSAF